MKKVVTHTTPRFHTDDVFAVAIFDLLYDGDIEVIRTHDKEVIDSADVVVDIGGEYDPERNRFDHHQKGGAGARKNGIEYASIGLVWKHYGEELCGSKEVADVVDEVVIQAIDAGDNGQTIFEINEGGVKPYLLQDIINLHRDYDGDDDQSLKQFLKAVEFAKFILEGEIKSAQDYVAAHEEAISVYDSSEDKKIIIFENEKYSSGVRSRILTEFPEPLYVVYPDSGRDSWRAKAVQEGENGFEMRKPLPSDWAGLKDEALQEVSGVEDAVFCHRALFTCAAKTKEGAIEMAKKALEN